MNNKQTDLLDSLKRIAKISSRLYEELKKDAEVLSEEEFSKKHLNFKKEELGFKKEVGKGYSRTNDTVTVSWKI